LARRLTDHTAYDYAPVWAPDGLSLAFTSDRKGNHDVFVVSANGGDVRQLTWHTGFDRATDFSPDGKWIMFRSGRFSAASLFRISVEGGNASPVLDTYWSRLYSAQYSPDGKKLLFSLGMENSSWWRRGYRGSNTTQLWQMDLENGSLSPLLRDSSNAYWPCWGPDGAAFYFVSDRGDDIKNIWRLDTEKDGPVSLTRFKKDDITWFSLADKAPLAVYERQFGLWITDLNSGESRSVPIQAPAEPKINRIFFEEKGDVSEFRISPDGKKIAAVVRGDIYVTAAEGGYARNVTETPWRERDVIWDKESRNLYYVSDVDADPELFTIPADGRSKTRRLTRHPEDVLFPRLSPDGRWLAYFHGKRQIRVMNSEGEKDRLLMEGDFGGRFADAFSWSPDSRFLAVVTTRNSNTDIVAVELETGRVTPLTNTAYDESDPQWSPDGKFLLFISNRYGHSFPEFTGKWDLYRLFLRPEKPEFDEEKFEKLFEVKTDDAKTKKESGEKKASDSLQVVFQLDNLDRQTRWITNTPGNDGPFYLSVADTQTVFFVSNMDGKSHLWKTSLDKKKRGGYEPFAAAVSRPRQLQPGPKGKKLYYLSNGRIGCLDLTKQSPKTISFNVRQEIDKSQEYKQMLGEVYYTLKYYFYDENHHQVDWDRIYRDYMPVMDQVRHDADFYDYANRMIGHLNSSHTGIRAPGSGGGKISSSHLGVKWEITRDGVKIRRLIKDGPLYYYRDSLAAGDRIIAIDGKPVSFETSIWKLLNGKPGRRIRVTIKSGRDGREMVLPVKPVSTREENRLLLEEWIQSRKKLVQEKSGGRLAYIYMRAMGYGDLQRFLKELERDGVPKQGLILDLRYNFGGNVHDRVIQALSKPVYARWKIRGLSERNQSTYGVAGKPLVVLINEVTLSDGEMTANGLKALNRGILMGNTTYGWLIFTTGVRLVNGGSFRLPFWGCYTLDGRDLETSGGVTPHVPVAQDLRHEIRGEDPQLMRAVEHLLGQLDENQEGRQP
jgi:tricorn protease